MISDRVLQFALFIGNKHCTCGKTLWETWLGKANVVTDKMLINGGLVLLTVTNAKFPDIIKAIILSNGTSWSIVCQFRTKGCYEFKV